MRRSALFSALCLLVALASPVRAGQPGPRFEGGRWVQEFNGAETLPGGARLRIVAQGPVMLAPDSAGSLTVLNFTTRVSVFARNEADARRGLEGYSIRVVTQGGWTTLVVPRGPAETLLTVRVPRGLREAAVITSEGAISIAALDCPLKAETGAGNIQADRLGGDSRLSSGGGDIRVVNAEGLLQAVTAGGSINVKSVRGEALLETGGGDVELEQVGGTARLGTSAGTIRVGNAGAGVIATTGGGPIIVGQAKGLVTVRNAAGPVQVGGAAGLRCETGAGAIKVANVSGALRVSTAMGSILASLLAGKMAESFLSTGNGDITVWIPSNLGVTVRAENEMADTIRRIISEFPAIPVRLRGTQVVAEGALNGGGPLLRISGMGGTIFIKRQP